MSEQVLTDDYPMHYGFLYIVGDKVFKNKVGFQTVGECRHKLHRAGLEPADVEIKKCDIKARNLWHLMEG